MCVVTDASYAIGMFWVCVCQPTAAPMRQESPTNQYDDNEIVNPSNNLHFEDILNARMSP